MKPPVPLNSSVVAVFCTLSVVALLLYTIDPAGRFQADVAQAPEAPKAPEAQEIPQAALKDLGGPGWDERDYLLHYAKTVCLRTAYSALDPAPSVVIEILDGEAWAMVEATHQGPEVYEAIHSRAVDAGKAQAPARALVGCSAWVEKAETGILKVAALDS